jgi:outer membrane protein TolC
MPAALREPPGGDIRLVKHQEPPAVEPIPPAAVSNAAGGVFLASYPIDLPTALRLADADNLQVALAREQIRQAYAEQRQAESLWLPSLRGGVHWNKHEGPLLSSSGNLVDVSRASLYAGAGGQAVGGGSPAIPGLFANFHFADALFQPLAARQRIGARRNAAAATRNDVLLSVALAYLELLRAVQDAAIVRDVHEKVRELSSITDAYVRTGQGLQSDADRMRVELALRENDIRRSEEAVASASARLAQLLRLEPCLRLEPVDCAVVPFCLIPQDIDCCVLVSEALGRRPEILQNRYLMGEALQRLRRESYAPFVPNLVMGASYGTFGGGRGDNLTGFDDRFDFDATAYWELRNLGSGEAAFRETARSRLRQAEIQQLATLDLIAREVSEAYAQVQLRGRQIETARLAVQSAIDSYQHNLVRIRQGQGLPIEVLQSTQALLQARREYLRALIDYNAAQFTLQRALGWPVEPVGPPLLP